MEIFEETLTKNISQIWQKLSRYNCKNVSLVHIIFDLSGVKNEETVSETVRELQLLHTQEVHETISGVLSASQDGNPRQYNRFKL